MNDGYSFPIAHNRDRGARAVIVASGAEFKDRLKELREAAGLSQYALAKKSGVTKQAISLLESGVNEPSWVTVRKLARGLGVATTVFEIGELPPIEGESASSHPPESPPPPRRRGKK